MNPFDHALEYFDAGWQPLPLPWQRKAPPPHGVTGVAGSIDRAQVDKWLLGTQVRNIGLRMPSGVIGLDVDDYEEKRGGHTLALSEAKYGCLPPTYVSSSREGLISGIRLFRVPQGFRSMSELAAETPGGDLVKDVEIIQFRHRFMVAWPSVHPLGRTYRWRDPAGEPIDRVPCVAGLPELPVSWQAALAQAVVPVRRPVSRQPVAELRADAQQMPAPSHLDVLTGEWAIRTRAGVALRQRAAWTVEDLAEGLGINRRRAAHLERGRLRHPRKSLLARYGALLRKLDPALTVTASELQELHDNPL